MFIVFEIRFCICILRAEYSNDVGDDSVFIKSLRNGIPASTAVLL